MHLRAAAIFLAVLLLYLALNFYIGWHIYTFLNGLFPVSGAWFWTGLYLVALAFLISVTFRKYVPATVSRTLKRIGVLWMAPFEYLLIMLPAVDLAWLVLRFTGVPADAFVPAAGAAVLIVLALILVRGAYNAWSPIVRRYQIEINKRTKVDRLKIAIASDLHLGLIVGKKHLNRLVERVNELDPDLVILAGDIIDEEAQPFKQKQLDRIMRNMRARYGRYAVLGNHEYYGGEVEQIVEALREAGIEMLLDERVFVADSVWLVGRKDRTAESALFGGRKPLNELLEGLNNDDPIIVIDHQPTALREAEKLGVDLIISGHTHRGQLAPNHWITRRLFDLDWGMKKSGSFHAIVSSGFGTWGPPFRLGSRAELIELEIRFPS